jgi:LCP family protein required for cell wall assembly
MLGIISGAGIDLKPWDTVRSLIAKEEPELKKDNQGRTNVLIVGIDTRPSSPGLQNTDTIIVLSYNHKTNDAVLLSIPRDTWVAHPDNEYYHLKINGIYNICENEKEGTGLDCLKQSAETLTDLDIQYYAMLDIAGLVEVVDTLGGVEVDVENTFTDYMFPASGGGYEIVSFDAGPQEMDGEEAMQYARSRHAQGPEGSDFARARRQQKLIIAIAQKILSLETYSNPLKVLDLAEQLGDSLKFSEITTEDIRASLNLAEDIDEDKVYSEVLDPSIGDYSIIGEDPSDAYILYPKLGIDQFDDLHEYINIYLEYPGMYNEEAVIYVYDGGYGYDNTYQKSLEILEKYPYSNVIFGGSIAGEYSNVVLAAFGDDIKYDTLSQMENYFNTSYSSETVKDLTARYGEDIMVILGIEEINENISE